MKFDGIYGSRSLKTLVAAAAVAVSGAAAHATTISIETFTVPDYQAAVGSGVTALQTFESYGVGEVGASLVTNVGTFTSLGGTGDGQSVIGTGTQLAVRQGDNFGRSSTTADLGLCGDVCPGGFLDSNDTFGINWAVNIGSLFDKIVFVLSDPNDAGARITVSAGDATQSIVTALESGVKKLVVISFGSAVDSATVKLDNGRTKNDGIGVDDISVSVVPLPAPALLLLAGLGGLAAMRRRKTAA